MSNLTKPIGALLSAVVLTMTATACTPTEIAQFQAVCRQRLTAAECDQLLREYQRQQQTPNPGKVTATPVNRDQAPNALRRWADAQQNKLDPAYEVLHQGTHTYLAITGGLQPTGGYQIRVKDVKRHGSGWRIEAEVVPPAAGGMVIQAETNPTGYFRLPRLEGDVTVNIIRPVPDRLTAMPVERDAVPAALQRWADSQRGKSAPDHKTADAGAYTYLAITGGVQATGGYDVVVRSVTRQGDGWRVEAAVVPPEPDEMVTQAETNPVGYFRLPRVQGNLTVSVSRATPERVTATPVEREDAPSALQRWADGQQNRKDPAHQLVNQGTYTYLAVAGGLQPTGGYKVEVRSVIRQGDGWQVTAAVIPPGPADMVTQVQTNPVGYFRLPRLEGDVNVSVQRVTPERVAATPVERKEAPSALQRWADEQMDRKEPAYRVMTHGDYTYLAAAGGLQPTGGYTVQVKNVVRQGSGWHIEAEVVAPGEDQMVIQALTNPIGFFRMPRLEGEVTVEIAVPQSDSAGKAINARGERMTLRGVWQEGNLRDGGLLYLSGEARVADVHFEVRAGNRVIAQADAQVKDGRYQNGIQVPATRHPHVELVASTVGDRSQVLLRVDLTPETDR